MLYLIKIMYLLRTENQGTYMIMKIYIIDISNTFLNFLQKQINLR